MWPSPTIKLPNFSGSISHIHRGAPKFWTHQNSLPTLWAGPGTPPVSPKHLHGWKGMVMTQELYALLTPALFCLLIDPGLVAVFIRPVVVPRQAPDPVPLTRMEQATIKTTFSCRKHYFMSMKNIECACFTVLNASINDTFKVSDDPAIPGWHAGMRIITNTPPSMASLLQL